MKEDTHCACKISKHFIIRYIRFSTFAQIESFINKGFRIN